MKLFCPRFSKQGMLNNPYWYDKSINAGAVGDSLLPNCTTYASGRFSELNGENMRNIMNNRTGFGNAKEWYSQTKLEKGSSPRLGAIACFDGALGHVAIVESINDDGTVTVSQSNYQTKKDYNSINYFQIKTYKLEVGKVASGVGLRFQGYIYPPNVRYAVQRDTTNDQVEILADRLKVRKSPNGDWVEGIFAPLGIYNIQDVQTAGDYTWAKLDDECWIALNDNEGWTKTYIKEVQDKSKEYNELLDKYNALENDYNTAIKDVNSLQNDWKASQLENIELSKQLKQAQTELDVVKADNELLSEKLKKIKEIVN